MISGHKTCHDWEETVWRINEVDPGPRLTLLFFYWDMSLYPSSWISLSRYQLTYLQMDSGNIRYRECSLFPSTQALPNINSNNTFLSILYEFNALK